MFSEAGKIHHAEVLMVGAVNIHFCPVSARTTRVPVIDHGFCSGCAHICDAAIAEMSYTSDIMRFLMYHNSYGDKNRAKEMFRQIPQAVRNRLLTIDYSIAEARCPQQLPIAKFIAQAVAKLA